MPLFQSFFPAFLGDSGAKFVILFVLSVKVLFGTSLKSQRAHSMAKVRLCIV